MDHAAMSLPQNSTSYVKRVQELSHMTMVAWRSYHKHLSTEVIGISFLHQGCRMLYPQTYNEYWSVNEKSGDNFDRACSRWCSVQVHCAAHKDVCTQQINDYYRFVKWWDLVEISGKIAKRTTHAGTEFGHSWPKTGLQLGSMRKLVNELSFQQRDRRVS